MTDPRLRRAAPWALPAIALLAFAVHLNTLGNGYALDDRPIVQDNPNVNGLATLDEALTQPYWPATPDRLALYRPITTAAFSLQFALWGDDPAGYHAVNALAHAGVTALVFLLLLALVPGLIPAALAASLFAVHPVHVEAVAGLVGLAELLSAIPYLAACLVYVRGRGGWRTALGVGALYFLSLSAKEGGATLPGMLVLLEVFRGGAGWRGAWGREEWAGVVGRLLSRWRVFALCVVALVAYGWIRAAVLGTALGNDFSPFLYGEPATTRIFTMIRIWPEYVRLLLFPLDLVVDYGPPVIVPERGLSVPVLVGLLTGMVAFWAVAAAWRREAAVSLGILWFMLAVFPVSNLVVPLSIWLAERTLYLPSVGAALVVAGAVHAIRVHRPAWLRPALAAGAIAVVLLGVRTWQRNPTWESNRTALNTLAAEHPGSYRIQWITAQQLLEAGQIEESLERFDLAATYAPGHYQINTDYGLVLMAAGRPAEAARRFDFARRLVPEHSQVDAYYVGALVEMRSFHGAVEEGLRAVTRHPENADLRHFLAVALTHTGDFDAALEHREAAVRLAGGRGPWSQWLHLAELRLRAGRGDQARQALERARSIAPADASVPDLETLRDAIDTGRDEVLPFR